MTYYFQILCAARLEKNKPDARIFDQCSEYNEIAPFVLGILIAESTGVLATKEPRSKIRPLSQLDAFNSKPVMDNRIRRRKETTSDRTYQPSSACRVPRSKKCILVPAGHLKAGTPAFAKSVDISDDDAIIVVAQSQGELRL